MKTKRRFLAVALVAVMVISTLAPAAIFAAAGIAAYYARDLGINPPAMFMQDIHVPFLIMQADNDWQVLADMCFVGYVELLGDRDNVTFKLYEGLNHAFMPSTATSLPAQLAEFVIPGTVNAQVLRDIAEWILGGQNP